MHKLFLDTDILLDWIFNREFYSLPAKKIITHGEENNVLLFMSAISISDINYIACKQIHDKIKLRKLISKILHLITVQPTQHKQIIDALGSDFRNLEIAFQYYSAKEIKGLTAIITRSKKDYATSDIPIYTAAEYMKMIK
ncbi:MAG: PIN domain nuclease [Bacteroidia bacterium]|nr:PIN domain nuclease [Bacteroidia bacterium]